MAMYMSPEFEYYPSAQTAYSSYYNEEAYNNSHYTPAPTSAAAGNGAHKVLAERYKTKLCKKWLEYGCCPYEVRCMFAHGEHELRTAEMNLHDGLVTEDAIRHFRRMMQFKSQPQEEAATEQPPNYDETLGYLASATTEKVQSSEVVKAYDRDNNSYRHNPYAFNVLTREDSEDTIEDEEPAAHDDDCDCGDCLYERASAPQPQQADYVYSGYYGATKTAAYDEHAEAMMP